MENYCHRTGAQPGPRPTLASQRLLFSLLCMEFFLSSSCWENGNFSVWTNPGENNFKCAWGTETFFSFFSLVLSDPEMDLPRITVQAVKAAPSPPSGISRQGLLCQYLQADLYKGGFSILRGSFTGRKTKTP